MVNRSKDDPDHFVLYEHYRHEEALRSHRESAHFQRLVGQTVIPILSKREWELFTLLDD
jgi:quinol monooxygenase YgiN